jgi:hypothetical protein
VQHAARRQQRKSISQAAQSHLDLMWQQPDAVEEGNAYNITVNGAIDSEGTARTIVRTINDSFYRGTGGSSQFAI